MLYTQNLKLVCTVQLSSQKILVNYLQYDFLDVYF